MAKEREENIKRIREELREGEAQQAKEGGIDLNLATALGMHQMQGPEPRSDTCLLLCILLELQQLRQRCNSSFSLEARICLIIPPKGKEQWRDGQLSSIDPHTLPTLYLYLDFYRSTWIQNPIPHTSFAIAYVTAARRP